jgi:hypothetical protein
VKTDDLIVQLARSAVPVRRLARPSVRLAQWAAAAVALAALCVLVIGPRVDVWIAVHQPAFVALAIVTLLTALLAAASSFVMSVPGAERSPLQRIAPLAAGAIWSVFLVLMLMAGGDAFQRVLALPVHWACVIEIAGIGFVPGWALLAMLRRAAPLHLAWNAALATLAAVSLGVVATQFICPIDDPAHQLVGHLFPAAMLVVVGTFAGRRSLDWLRAS